MERPSAGAPYVSGKRWSAPNILFGAPSADREATAYGPKRGQGAAQCADVEARLASQAARVAEDVLSGEGDGLTTDSEHFVRARRSRV